MSSQSRGVFWKKKFAFKNLTCCWGKWPATKEIKRIKWKKISYRSYPLICIYTISSWCPKDNPLHDFIEFCSAHSNTNALAVKGLNTKSVLACVSSEYELFAQYYQDIDRNCKGICRMSHNDHYFGDIYSQG